MIAAPGRRRKTGRRAKLPTIPPKMIPRSTAALMHGADHALPLRQLKQMTGLPGRDLRRRIEAARIAGEPILSDGNGYFLAENQHEVTQFVTSMNRRAKRIQAVAAAVERIAVE